jgi:predicted RNase H-like nuclease (RuvC/YqgF family)
VRKSRLAAPSELDHLELTIRRLIESHDALRRRAENAEARIRELESAMKDLSGGRIDPVALSEEVTRLESHNHRLQERLTQAHAAVLRMTARLQFTAEER